MKNSYRKNIFQQVFNPNGQVIFKLPADGKILQGRIVVTGNVVLSNVTAQGTVRGEGGPTRLINRIIVRGNPAAGSRYPGGELVYCTPRSLLRIAQRYHFGKFVAEQSGSVLGSGAAGTYPIYLSIPIYWSDPSSRNPVWTALNADPTAYQTITVEVDTADITNCFTGWTGEQDLTNLQVQWIDERENFSGDTYSLFQEDHELFISVTNNRTLDNAMPLDGSFTDWLFLEEQSAQRTLADTLLNRVTLSGTAIDYDEWKKDIRQSMIDKRQFDPSQNLAGIDFINFTDGLITGAIDASTLQAQFDLTNVSGANNDDLLIYTRRIFTPTNFSPAWGQKGKNS